MKFPAKFLALVLAASAVAGFAPNGFAAKTSAKEARVTQIFREVKLLPAKEDAHAAAMNDRVAEDTGVRTGERSRSELTFTDLTIERLGANTIFSFNRGGRNVDLGGGSILLRVPKDSGGANVRAPAVSVAVTGTTFILETARGGRSKLIVLEGSARLRLTSNPAQSRNVPAGQKLEVPAGATMLPEPVNFDVDEVMNTHPLIVGFPPLPSRELIAATANRQHAGEPVYQGQPVGSGGGNPIATGGVGLPGILPTGLFGGGGRGGRGNAGATTAGSNTSGVKGGGKTTRGQRNPPTAKPTPAPNNPSGPR